MSYESLIVEREGAIGIISLNRPPANPFNVTMATELERALDELEDDEGIRALIFTGAGEKGFSAGADLKDFFSLAKVDLQALFTRVERYPKPSIAAINGYALAGGCELALACTFRLMADSEGVVVGITEVDRGLMPGAGGTQRLPRLVGKAKALEMLVLGSRLTAREALEIGLVNQICKKEELMDRAKDLAERICRQAPVAVRWIIDSVNRGLDCGLDEGLAIERGNFMTVVTSEDAAEGIRAFVEKGEPRYVGK